MSTAPPSDPPRRRSTNWALVLMLPVGVISILVGVIWAIYVAWILRDHPLDILDPLSVEAYVNANANYAIAGGIVAWGFFLLNAAWIVAAIRHRNQ